MFAIKVTHRYTFHKKLFVRKQIYSKTCIFFPDISNKSFWHNKIFYHISKDKKLNVKMVIIEIVGNRSDYDRSIANTNNLKV